MIRQHTNSNMQCNKTLIDRHKWAWAWAH